MPNNIEEYTEQAIEHAAICLLWQASDAGERGNGFPMAQAGDYTDQVTPLITDDVTAFIAANWALLQTGNVQAEQCGHDLILTANGHGAGFWDRGLDMPGNDPEALIAWKISPGAYRAWLAEYRPNLTDLPKTVGDLLTEATSNYAFDAEFRLWDDDADDDEHCSDELAWLMVENTVLLDDLGWSAE